MGVGKTCQNCNWFKKSWLQCRIKPPVFVEDDINQFPGADMSVFCGLHTKIKPLTNSSCGNCLVFCKQESECRHDPPVNGDRNSCFPKVEVDVLCGGWRKKGG